MVYWFEKIICTADYRINIICNIIDNHISKYLFKNHQKYDYNRNTFKYLFLKPYNYYTILNASIASTICS